MEKTQRVANVSMKLSTLEFPPTYDVLIVGRRAAIGPTAAQRMEDAIAPDQYVVVYVTDESVEALIIRKRLLEKVPQPALTRMLLDEADRYAKDDCVVSGQIEIDITVNGKVSL